MNWLDRAFVALAPRLALGRVEARVRLALMQRGGFEAGRVDWRASSFRVGESNGANTSLWGDIQIMRRRARSLVRNNPLAKRAITILTAHTVGTGLRPAWQTDSQAARKRLRAAWDRYVDTADARRQVDLYGLQEQAVRGMFEAGETLALRQRQTKDGDHRLSWLLIEGEQLDHQRDGIFDEGLVTRLGVALQKDAHDVAGYYLFDQNPDDALLWGFFPYSRFRPADGILHLYRIRRPGQLRGVPELAASIPMLRDLSDYIEAAIVKARVEACFTAFITSEDAGTATLAQRVDQRAGADGTAHDVNYGELSPGMMQRLRPGEDVKFGQPSSQSDFAGFMRQGAMQAASGMGVTYDQATGDLSQANYSSLRAGKIEFRREIEMLQHLTVIPMLCKPMYREFIEFSRDFGQLSASDARIPVRWVTPAWEPIDPVKDLNADIAAVRSGRMSLGDFIASWGEDPHEQLSEIAAFNAELDRLGITLDTDPRKTSAGGQKQMPDPAEPDGVPAKT
jgi:lambda family phage portal protein